MSELGDLSQEMEGHPSFAKWVVARLREASDGGRPFPSCQEEAEGLRFQDRRVKQGGWIFESLFETLVTSLPCCADQEDHLEEEPNDSSQVKGQAAPKNTGSKGSYFVRFFLSSRWETVIWMTRPEWFGVSFCVLDSAMFL